ncbi:MAG: LCP family protein [Peptostreptococcales bacterium]
MKTFMKYFVVTFIIFTVVFTGVMWAYDSIFLDVKKPVGDGLIVNNPIEGEEDENSFAHMFNKSNRVNVLLLGMESIRTDTIMLASFDPKIKRVDIISIPRDTHYERSERHSAERKKINAVYYDEKMEGLQAAVSDLLLGIPIDYYIKVEYDGVKKIVDSLGGVPVYVPMNMKYDDPYDKPPLHINIEKGQRTLNGEQAIKFLRFRKNNDGTGYPNGDLGRIKTQQEFMKAAFKKTLSFRLPIVANTVVKYIKTDIPLSEVASLAASAVGMSSNSIYTYSLPGKDAYAEGLSFYWQDVSQTAELLESLYKTGNDEDQE